MKNTIIAFVAIIFAFGVLWSIAFMSVSKRDPAKPKKDFFFLSLILILCTGGFCLIDGLLIPCTETGNRMVFNIESTEKVYTVSDSSELSSAMQALESKQKYSIVTYIEEPSNTSYYVETVDNNESYTMYPAGDTYEDYWKRGSDAVFNLTDWLTESQDLYLISDDGVSDAIYTTPHEYGQSLAGRRVMYLGDMRFTYLEKSEEPITVNFGEGDIELTVYKAELPSEYVEEIFNKGQLNLYKSMRANLDDSDENKNMKNLLKAYEDELDMNLTFSKGNVTIGVSDGVLIYISIETGGLGSRLYLTKVIMLDDVLEMEKPNFEGATYYADSLSDFANYVASFNSYQDAMDALYSSQDKYERDFGGVDTDLIDEPIEDGAESIEDGGESIEDGGEPVENADELDETDSETDEVSQETIQTEQIVEEEQDEG